MAGTDKVAECLNRLSETNSSLEKAYSDLRKEVRSHNKTKDLLLEVTSTCQLFLDTTSDSIFILDSVGRIITASTVAYEILGVSSVDHLFGQSIFNFIHIQDRERAENDFLTLVSSTIAQKKVVYLAQRKDGECFRVQIFAAPVFSANKKIVKVIVSVGGVNGERDSVRMVAKLLKQLRKEKKIACQDAATDSLTGIANRRYFDQVLDVEFKRLRRSKLPFSLIMIDLDYFKDYNDLYGHLSGDSCLQEVSDLLLSVAQRVVDLVARYGGEEFVILLPETGREGAAQIAEKLRQEIKKLAIPHECSATKYLTASMGIFSEDSLEKFTSPEELIAMADIALYRAKEQGRDRWVFFS